MVRFGWFRRRRDLVLENAALRQPLAMYERRRPGIHDSDRMRWVWLVRIWPGWRGVVIAIRPDDLPPENGSSCRDRESVQNWKKGEQHEQAEAVRSRGDHRQAEGGRGVLSDLRAVGGQN